ncbi:hypothetical protein RB195_016798 [Necator americanus]
MTNKPAFAYPSTIDQASILLFVNSEAVISTRITPKKFQEYLWVGSKYMNRRPTAVVRKSARLTSEFETSETGQGSVHLEFADDVVIFASSSAKSQHAVSLAPELTAAYGRSDKYKKMWVLFEALNGIQRRQTTY